MKRCFFIGRKWVTIESAPNPTPKAALLINTWSVDAATGQPEKLQSSIPVSRNELFDIVCGLMCVVMDTEPDGLFDTSHCIDTGSHHPGHTENVSELMDRLEVVDPMEGIRQTVAMFRRLDNRLPVLQRCQRALEMCTSDFDVNVLDEIAGRMETNRSIDDVVPEAFKDDFEVPADCVAERRVTNADLLVDNAYVGLHEYPEEATEEVLNTWTDEYGEPPVKWGFPDDHTDTPLCEVLRKMDLPVAQFADGSLQIRSEIYTKFRTLSECIYTPRLCYRELLRFCSFAMPQFETMLHQANEKEKDLEGPPVPGTSLRLLLSSEKNVVVH